jgi:aspartyl/glutamyl-tRNA(Asn/Gln) amidotransferase C subunit
MELSTNEIIKLAALARLKLTAAETEHYQHSLRAILGHVARLQSYMAGKEAVVDRRVVADPVELRADHPSPAASEWPANRDEFLASARAVKDHRIVVPGVFGQGKS